VNWAPTGPRACASPVPLGVETTRASITLHSPPSLAGRAVAELHRRGGCAAASGEWRGADGALAGRDGRLALAVDDAGIVRLTLSGIAAPN
jgi:hypothetical protein